MKYFSGQIVIHFIAAEWALISLIIYIVSNDHILKFLFEEVYRIFPIEATQYTGELCASIDAAHLKK